MKICDYCRPQLLLGIYGICPPICQVYLEILDFVETYSSLVMIAAVAMAENTTAGGHRVSISYVRMIGKLAS